MSGRTLSLLGGLLLIAGCKSAGPMDMGDMQKPSPPMQMAQLDRLIGSWEGTAEMVYPEMPERSDTPNSFAGGGKWERTMDGMYLRSEGWHEMGPDVKMKSVEYIAWDAGAGAFRTFWFSDFGEFGTGTMRTSADGSGFTVKAKSTDASGESKNGSGKMTFVDNDTVEWTWAERNWMGSKLMEFKGTMKRK
jgi:hypothetical protein